MTMCVSHTPLANSSLPISGEKDTDGDSTLTSSSLKPSYISSGVDKLEGYEARSKSGKTLIDYVTVAGVISALPVVMINDVLANMVASKKRRRPAHDVLLDSMMGHCYTSSTLTQLLILTGTRSLKQELSGLLYKLGGYTRKLENYNKEFISEDSTFVARWVHEVPNRTKDDPVLLYFHGGGYALKICSPQVQYICDLARQLALHRTSVLILDYTITPYMCYPVQRNQAIACIKALEKTCSKIILLGDSCGGNLALSVLQEEKGPMALDYSKIYGCTLISPWVDPGAQGGSMNSKRDILSSRRLNDMTRNYVHPEQLKDPLVSPLLANPEVWTRVLPKNTCCVWGDLECLADQNVQFQKKAKIDNYMIEKNGTHDCILRGMSPEPCKFITTQLLSWVQPVEFETRGKEIARS